MTKITIPDSPKGVKVPLSFVSNVDSTEAPPAEVIVTSSDPAIFTALLVSDPAGDSVVFRRVASSGTGTVTVSSGAISQVSDVEIVPVTLAGISFDIDKATFVD
jgi:hypothetical protein